MVGSSNSKRTRALNQSRSAINCARAQVTNGIKVTVKIKKAGSIVSIAARKAVSKIKGTEFVLENHEDSAVVKVLRGAVEVTGISNGRPAVLCEGEKCTCTDNTLDKETFSVSTEQAKWSTEGATSGGASTPQTADSQITRGLKSVHFPAS